METFKLIIQILAVLFTFLGSAVPLAVKLSAANKARKAAETAAEREKAVNDMLATAQGLVESAEEAFAGFDAVMKKQGSSAGAMKKDNVFTKLQTYALQRGYEFDADYWRAKIDEIVAFTRKVNAKENAENTNKTA
jgi:hypothetical protein